VRQWRMQPVPRRWGALLLAGLILAAAATAAFACPEPQQKEADHAFAMAAQFVKAKNWSQAIPALESALSICPDHVKSLKYLGRAYYATGQYEKARKAQEKLIEAAGGNAEASDYMDLGKTYAKLKMYKLARQAYVRAQTLEPDDCAILFNLGLMNYAVKDYRHAVETLEHCLEACPDLQKKVYKPLSKAALKASEKEKRLGNVELAQEYQKKYKQYAANAGGNTGYQLIVKAMKKKDYAEAARLCRDFVARYPKHASAWLSLARSLEQLKDYAGAADAYAHYRELRPEDHRAAGYEVEMLARAGKCEEAIARAQAAEKEFLPKGKTYLAEIYYGWGKALECAKRYADAKAMFRKVLACGNDTLSRYARAEMDRQDQLLEIERRKRLNAGG